MKKFKEGTFVYYGLQNELGLIKRIVDDRCFVWYHMGGTCARTPFSIIEPITVNDIMNSPDFSNEYAVPSLLERYIRFHTEGDTSDLIDGGDIRPNVLHLAWRLEDKLWNS